MTDMRSEYSKTLIQIGRENPDVVMEKLFKLNFKIQFILLLINQILII